MRLLITGIMASLLLANIALSAECQFNTPAINTDVCKTLNLDNKAEDNPFFLKNGNGLCGIDFQLSGLPDFSLKDAVPNLSSGEACQYLKYLTGDQVSANIQNLISGM